MNISVMHNNVSSRGYIRMGNKELVNTGDVTRLGWNNGSFGFEYLKETENGEIEKTFKSIYGPKSSGKSADKAYAIYAAACANPNIIVELG